NDFTARWNLRERTRFRVPKGGSTHGQDDGLPTELRKILCEPQRALQSAAPGEGWEVESDEQNGAHDAKLESAKVGACLACACLGANFLTRAFRSAAAGGR